MKTLERGSIRSNLQGDSECSELGERNRGCMDIKEFLSKKPSANQILEFVESEARKIAKEKDKTN